MIDFYKRLNKIQTKMGLVRNIFNLTPKKQSYLLSLDIGTELTKVLLLKIDSEQKKALVVGQAMIRQKLGHMSSGAVSDIAGVIETCQQGIIEVKKQAGIKSVSRVIMGIAGELVKGTTTTVHYQRARPEIRIDLPEIKSIIQKVQWKAFDRIRKQLAWETGQDQIDVKLINAAIVSVKIDGYRIANPLGFQGRDVSIGVFNAYAPMIHLGALQKIADELDLDLLAIAAEPYAITQSINTHNQPEFGAIILDIGGGTTDVALVRNGGLEGTVMFALGGQAFTKRLAHIFNISFPEAEKLKIRYSIGQINQQLTKQIQQIFANDLKIWLSGLKISLESFVSSDILPSNILLCGGGSGLPGIKEILEQDDWESTLPIPESLKINYLQPRDITGIIDKTGKLRSPQSIAPMALGNLALDIIQKQENNLLSEALGKAVKNIQG